jgi:hypothetical protein
VPVFEFRRQEIDHMSKSNDAKKDTKKKPQKTLMEKRQAKRDKKNKPMSIS